MVTAHQKNSTQTWTYRSGSQQNYTSGQLWINITTTDAYGRTAVDVYTFTIDDEVTSTPTLATTGTQTIINGSTYLGANGRITLANLIDAGGVGVDSAECFWNANTQANTYSATASLTPPSNADQTTPFTLNCRIVDQVGNIGNNTTIFGFVDLQTPTTTILPMAGNTITANSTISLCNHGCKPERNINGDHHMGQCNQFMEHNGRLQRYMDGIHCRTQQQPG